MVYKAQYLHPKSIIEAESSRKLKNYLKIVKDSTRLNAFSYIPQLVLSKLLKIVIHFSQHPVFTAHGHAVIL